MLIKKLIILLFFNTILLGQELIVPIDSLAQSNKDKDKAVLLDTPAKEASDTTAKFSLKEKIDIPGGDKLSEIFSVWKIIWAVIFFIIGFYAIKLVTTLLNKFSERSAKYRITLKGLIPVMRILGWTFIITFVVVGIFAPPIQTVFVISGSLGIAVGFASQDILKNIFGGIMIIFDRPFQVGDKIQVGSHYGEVTNIGLRSIRLVTADDSTVSVPNGEIMMQSISNSNSGETNCQVVAEIYLPVYVDTSRIRAIALKCAQVSRYVYLNKPISVIFKNEITEQRSVLKMRLKAYVLDIRYEFAFMSEMTETTIRELLDQKILTKEELHGLNQS